MDLAALQARQRHVLIVVLVINAGTFVMMVAASFIGHSSSLLSGALDNFGDFMTYLLSLAVIGASAAAKAKVA
ncbi:MAG: cation transporter, partial [Woeseiaceae bacterium]